MKKSNLLLFVFIVFIQFHIQGQSNDVYANVSDVNSNTVTNNDATESSAVQDNGEATSTSAKSGSTLSAKEQEEKEQLEREARLYAAEQALQRKLAFIDLNKAAVVSKIATYNESLEACRCGKAITDDTDDESIEFKALSMVQIRAHFIDKNISFAKKYMESLNNCKK
ncbi:hypothetical protein [uncultured Lacinutrix sp.]|uniref:hypothetical protein n=1 Tax=uncultured Lacinutrix sp. TaxID=574032 RepID=UPI00262AA5E4|nr:hypothetical protein [uncultured Lacinutrix sp.]